ncbi:hypothetical protein ACFPOE_05950 [Caenimonas terrae]|uniref:Alkaline phytoceramidase n=1 Tax=Caenimonas terrae TaxID=696074 RepID=A0ABW0N934_9BURK
MRLPLSRAETVLLSAAVALFLVAVFGPALSQPGDYHRFADQRALWQLPHAMDVLSNLPFVLTALLGGAALWQARMALSNVQRAMAALFFGGLLLAAAGSGWYHIAPDDAGLAVDRSAMAVAFAGLLGLAAAGRVSERAGAWLGLSVLLLGPLAAHLASASGNVLPWAVLQFGGMAAVLALALRPARAGTLPLPLAAVIACYAAAKLLEINDQGIYALTGHWVSGHTLKHVVAALAAFPVVAALRAAAEPRQNAPGATTNRPAARRDAGHA